MIELDELLVNRLINKLNSINKDKLSDNHIVLLPDFFVDHFLTLPEIENSLPLIENIYKQGGGNIPGVPQKIIQGGNASNTALALANLGFSSHLICRTDKLGLHLLEYFLGKKGVDLSCVKADGKLAVTAALEFGAKRTNVMVGDTGSVSDFSFEILDESDRELILSSSMVCVTNWNLNKEGTGLAQEIFRLAKKQNVKTFFDTGDPSPRKNEIPNLIDSVLADKNLDVLGLNENELFYYSGIEINSVDNAIKALNQLKKKIHARVDLHTASYACSIGEKSTLVPTPNIKNKYRSTGAGDAWNAGNIFADLLGFSDDERLLFANSVACCYISSAEPMHPTLEEVLRFISKSLNI